METTLKFGLIHEFVIQMALNPFKLNTNNNQFTIKGDANVLINQQNYIFTTCIAIFVLMIFILFYLFHYLLQKLRIKLFSIIQN